MNIASLGLCKELYKLSGWKDEANTQPDDELKWWNFSDDVPLELAGMKLSRSWYLQAGEGWGAKYPAYDLGYLLRKLPGHITLQSTTWDDVHTELPKGQELTYQAAACYQSNIKGLLFQQVADTLEDAACKLAIELFKQGILTKENK